MVVSGFESVGWAAAGVGAGVAVGAAARTAAGAAARVALGRSWVVEGKGSEGSGTALWKSLGDVVGGTEGSQENCAALGLRLEAPG